MYRIKRLWICLVVPYSCRGFTVNLVQRFLDHRLKSSQIPPSWSNPTRKYHVGLKNCFQLFPKQLRERLSKEYKQKVFDPPHRTALSQAYAKLDGIDSKQDNQVVLFI